MLLDNEEINHLKHIKNVVRKFKDEKKLKFRDIENKITNHSLAFHQFV